MHIKRDDEGNIVGLARSCPCAITRPGNDGIDVKNPLPGWVEAIEDDQVGIESYLAENSAGS